AAVASGRLGVTPVFFDSQNDGVAAAHDAVNLLRDKGYLVSGDLVVVTQRVEWPQGGLFYLPARGQSGPGSRSAYQRT
ncbi:hypothetical protein, partial [Klebsiella pneumoniae]|uniref:hypothetical protein n=1 Tax=Klebsiella pneumoniae TaxID=573 RepID=UPI00210C6544